MTKKATTPKPAVPPAKSPAAAGGSSGTTKKPRNKPADSGPATGPAGVRKNAPLPPELIIPRRKPGPPIRMVERQKRDPNAPKSFVERAASDPSLLVRALFQRPTWLDDFAALLLISVGMVSLLTLLNASPNEIATLSDSWADLISQIFGRVGAMLLSVMMVAAGALIVLPKIGIVFHLPWRRILAIEIAYLALLALLHLLANDPEPRALARAGLGGGYIGWALSQIVVKLFGSGLAILMYLAVIGFSIGSMFGLRRKHVRAWAKTASLRMEGISETLKARAAAPRQPRPERQRFGSRFRVRRADVPMAVLPPERPPDLTRPEVAVYGTPSISPDATPSPYPRPVPPPANPPIGTRAATPVTPRPAPVEPVAEEPAAPAPEPIRPRPLGTPARPTAQPTAQPPARTGKPLPALSHVSESPDEDEPPALPTPEAPTAIPSLNAAAQPPTSSTPTVQPVMPERQRRYFTVEDFKEVRRAIPRPNLPPITLLSDTELDKPTESEINSNARIIENTLLEFDIDVEVVDVKVGPTVTQYAVQPFREVTNEAGETVTQRVRVNRIASLASDLALALAAKRLRIQPYVPGHSYMGIEVPNRRPSVVALRPVMETEVFYKSYLKNDPDAQDGVREVPLAVPLGRDVSGEAVVVDLATMPHVLVAGTTGSGKSVCITALAVALVMNNLPDRLKLIMLDPKMVELTRFNGLPHLLGPVETDIERIIGVLRWATREMDRRYKLLETEGARNIEAYNRIVGKRDPSELLPYIVILIDEIGDLMMARPEEMERTVTRLAQMARAVGMHLVVATQRPSTDVITGLIKANFPARISFAVASGVDSRVILDATGAETLMGRGDMLYIAPDSAVPRRVQGCYVSDEEIDAVMAHWRNWQAEGEATGTRDAIEVAPWERGLTRREALSKTDFMLEDAIDLVVKKGEASTSLIQRQLNIPYPRAAHLMDLLNELGILGALKEDGRTREVTMKPGTDPYRKLMAKYRR